LSTLEIITAVASTEDLSRVSSWYVPGGRRMWPGSIKDCVTTIVVAPV
jgi:hypothetical protein